MTAFDATVDEDPRSANDTSAPGFDDSTPETDTHWPHAHTLKERMHEVAYGSLPDVVTDHQREAAAEALFEHRYRDEDIPAPWPAMPKSHRESYRRQADAALAAIAAVPRTEEENVVRPMTVRKLAVISLLLILPVFVHSVISSGWLHALVMLGIGTGLLTLTAIWALIARRFVYGKRKARS